MMRTVTAQEIIQRAAQSAEQPVEVSALVMGAVIEVMRDELRQGNRIVLPDLVSLQMTPGGTLESRLDSGVRPALGPEVVPASAPAPGGAFEVVGDVESFSFDVPDAPGAAAAVRAPALARAIVAEAAPALRTAAGIAGKHRVLFVVPIRDMFTNIMAQRLEGPNRAVAVAEGVHKAEQDIGQSPPALLLLDGNLAEADRIVREVKVDRRHGLMATVVVYPEGTDPTRVNGLRVCEDESIQEPFDMGDLVQLVDGELTRIAEERNFFDQEVHFQFRTAEEHIEKANDLVAQLAEQSGLDEEKAAALAVAFREAVDNAARHGNKSQEHKIIDAIYLLDKQKVTVTVEDEGEGFDTELYLTRGVEGNAVAAARERNRAGRVGGLGIMLMLKCLDDLEYNYVGNLVKLTKYR